MTWTKLSDDFYDNDEVNALSHEAFRLHIYAMGWANKQLTNGLVSMTRLRRLIPEIDTSAAATELILAGLWADASDGCFQIDWAHQETSQQVEDRRRANADRQRKFRQRQVLHAAGDHSECDKRFCKEARNGVTNTVSNTTPTIPVPSEGQGQGTAACGHKPLPGDTHHCEMGCLLKEVS